MSEQLSLLNPPQDPADAITLAHYAELLKRITDCAFNEGEHAA